MKKLLVISNRHTADVENMLQHMRSIMKNVEIDYTLYDNLVFSFISGKMYVRVENTGLDLADYDMAYFKSTMLYDITAAFVQYARHNGVKVVDVSQGAYPGASKLYTYSIIVGQNIAIPNTLFTMPNRLPYAYDLYAETLGVPFVLKGLHASRGDINEVVRSREDFERIATAALQHEKTQYLLGQTFVSNDGDLRILVFGGNAELVIHRKRADDSTHLNNTSQGGLATVIPVDKLPRKLIETSNKAARLLQLGIAGVDMVKDKNTGNWLCFEVNEGPQMATGSYRKEKWDKLADYFMTELEK